MTIKTTGLLIIRAWQEDGPGPRLRAEVSLTNDVTTGFDRRLTLVRPDEVADAVKRWLAEIQEES